ncbi:MAG: ATP-binding cassette domain-containing protein [[Clostridium] scindens]
MLDQFYVEILSGEIMNLIGLEGSGKEEIYSILFGDECADKGEVWFAGRSMKKGRNCPSKDPTDIFYRKSRTDHSEPERGREPVYY